MHEINRVLRYVLCDDRKLKCQLMYFLGMHLLVREKSGYLPVCFNDLFYLLMELSTNYKSQSDMVVIKSEINYISIKLAYNLFFLLALYHKQAST